MRNTLLMITALVMLFVACSKDEPRSEKIILSEMSQIETDIIDFLEKIDNEQEGSLPVADAVFFLEAGFNYRYAHIGNDTAFTTTRIDTSYVNLEVFEGYSTYTEMKTAFNDIYDEMAVLFEAIDDDKKALSIIQVTHEDDNSLRVISVWKHSVLSYAGDWKWGGKAGKCDGTQTGRDATDAIMFFYKIHFSNPAPYGIWTNIAFSGYHWGGSTLLQTTDNPFGYDFSLLFNYVQWVGQPMHCLTQNECYYYASLLPEAINRIVDDEAISNPIMDIELGWDIIPSGTNPYPIMHRLRVIHGSFTHGSNIPLPSFYSI